MEKCYIIRQLFYELVITNKFMSKEHFNLRAA